MSVYRRILLIVDLTDDSLPIGRRAQAIAASVGAEVELLHVVELVPVEPVGETLMTTVQIEEGLAARARTRLTALAAELGIPDAHCQVEVGSVKSDIVRIARARRRSHRSRQPRAPWTVDSRQFHRGHRSARGAM
jgi:universal stress protein A